MKMLGLQAEWVVFRDTWSGETSNQGKCLFLVEHGRNGYFQNK